MKLYNPTREERAFLYQEAHDLESLARGIGSLAILVEELDEGATDQGAFRVTFLIAPESIGMQVQATDDDLFSAAISAKQETLRQLNALVNSLPQSAAGVDPATAAKIKELMH